LAERSLARTLPAEAYRTDWSHLAAERAFLEQAWLFVAHESCLAKPGDVVVETLLGCPILVRRSEDGHLRGFYNVCQHRGGPLAMPGTSRCKVLKCRYHGWVYDQSGRLVGTPGFAAQPPSDFTIADHSLQSIAVDCWGGLVFVQLSNDVPASAGRPSRVLADAMENLDPRAMAPRSTRSFRFACNWKLYVENWLESYHFPWVHSHLGEDVDTTRYEIACGDGIVTHRAPQKEAQSVYGGLWAWLAPCTAINTYGSGISVERILPDGPTGVRVDYTFLFPSGVSGQEEQRVLSMCEEVTREDGEMCERVQENLSAAPFDGGPLSPDHESGIAYFHDLLRERILGSSEDRAGRVSPVQ
jgi:choline monooxygenase